MGLESLLQYDLIFSNYIPSDTIHKSVYNLKHWGLGIPRVFLERDTV